MSNILTESIDVNFEDEAYDLHELKKVNTYIIDPILLTEESLN